MSRPAHHRFESQTPRWESAVLAYYAGSITYWPNGMVQTVGHAKRVFEVMAGVRKTQSIDNGVNGAWMARPAGLATGALHLLRRRHRQGAHHPGGDCRNLHI